MLSTSNLQVTDFGSKARTCFFDELGDFFRILIGNEARGKFCVSFCGDYGFRAFAGVAAPDAVEFKRRTCPQTFDDGETFLAEISGSADGLAGNLFLSTQRVQEFAFCFGKLGDTVIEAWNGDAEILVV